MFPFKKLILIAESKVWLIYLYFFISFQSAKTETGWVLDFIQYIKKDAGVHQIVVFVDTYTRQDSGMDTIIQEMIGSFPSIKMDSNDLQIEKARKLIQTPFFLNPQTSLFITIQSEDDDQGQFKLTKIHDFLTELCQNRKRPKYLMMFFQDKENHNFEQLLRQLWSKQFLDATVLEIVQPRDMKKDVSSDHDQETVTVHCFNPFTETLASRKYSHKVQWFPDKLRDMHEYQMKISFIHNPPEVIVKRNKSSFDVSGLMEMKMNALSKAMNFRIWIPENMTTYGRFSCLKNGSTDVYDSLRNNKLHLNAEEFMRPGCDETLYEWSKGITSHDICLVMPILTNETLLLTTTWKVWNGVVVMTAPLIIWFIPRLLHFEPRNWRLTYIVQMSFGFGIPREPHRQAERIVFVGILWAYFLYSSVLYTGLTSIVVDQEVPIKSQSIEDIVASNLQPIMKPDYYALMYNRSDGGLRQLLDKATKFDVSGEQCLNRLITHKNVVCILKEIHARAILRDQKDSCGRPVAKIMVIMKTLSNTVLEPGSPFVKRIGNLIQRLTESGAVQKWKNKYDNELSIPVDSSISCTQKKSEMTHIIKQNFLEQFRALFKAHKTSDPPLPLKDAENEVTT